MKTLTDILSDLNVRMTWKQVSTRPRVKEWSEGTAHYRVTFSRLGKRFTCYFSKGSGHRGQPPILKDVMESLYLDADIAASTFEEFCSDFGVSTDSRKEKACYDLCVRQTKRLQRFLGPAGFDRCREAVQASEQ